MFPVKSGTEFIQIKILEINYRVPSGQLRENLEILEKRLFSEKSGKPGKVRESQKKV